jgi:hypothetical protein
MSVASRLSAVSVSAPNPFQYDYDPQQAQAQGRVQPGRQSKARAAARIKAAGQSLRLSHGLHYTCVPHTQTRTHTPSQVRQLSRAPHRRDPTNKQAFNTPTRL